MMSTLEIVQAAVDALNARDFERLAHYIADHAQITTFGGGEPTGKEAYLGILRSLVAAIPDLWTSLEDVRPHAENVVVLTLVMSGKHTGDLIVSGMLISPPTGRDVHLVLRERMVTAQNGQLVSVESTLDPTLPTLLTQLGIPLPRPGDD